MKKLVKRIGWLVRKAGVEEKEWRVWPEELRKEIVIEIGMCCGKGCSFMKRKKDLKGLNGLGRYWDWLKLKLCLLGNHIHLKLWLRGNKR